MRIFQTEKNKYDKEQRRWHILDEKLTDTMTMYSICSQGNRDSERGEMSQWFPEATLCYQCLLAGYKAGKLTVLPLDPKR